MYEEQKQLFEENFLRAELKAVTKNWWLDEDVFGNLVPKEGQCCILSPSLIGKKNRNVRTYGLVLAEEYAVSLEWVNGAISGFDYMPPSLNYNRKYMDGYAWGQSMRKYLPPKEEVG